MGPEDIEELIERLRKSSRVHPAGPEFLEHIELFGTSERGAKWGLHIQLGEECPLYVFGRVYIALAETLPKDSTEYFLSDVQLKDGCMIIQILGGCEKQVNQ